MSSVADVSEEHVSYWIFYGDEDDIYAAAATHRGRFQVFIHLGADNVIYFISCLLQATGSYEYGKGVTRTGKYWFREKRREEKRREEKRREDNKREGKERREEKKMKEDVERKEEKEREERKGKKRREDNKREEKKGKER
jgi:hypothetical protein